MRRLFRICRAVPLCIACVALLALMVMTFCDVVLRSSFDAPIEAATELTRILVAVMVFSVMPHVSITGGHIAVDLLDGLYASARALRLRDGLIQVFCAFLLFWPIERVWVLTERTRDYGDVTQTLAIPQYLTMGFIGLGLTATSIAMLVGGLLTVFSPALFGKDAS